MSGLNACMGGDRKALGKCDDGSGGGGDVTGPGPLVTDDAVACWDGTGGLTLKAGAVTCTEIAQHIASTENPHQTDINNLGSGTLAELNAVITDATLDTNTASRPPNGTAAGDLNGSYPNPGFINGAPVETPVLDDHTAFADGSDAEAIKSCRLSAMPYLQKITNGTQLQNGVVLTNSTGGEVTKAAEAKFVGPALCLPLINKTGAIAVVGDIVSVDLANDDAFVLTTGTADERFCGVVMDSNVADGSICYIAVAGRVTVNMDATAIIRGDFIDPSPTPGKGHPHAGPTPSVFGIATTDKALGVGGCQVWLNGAERF